MQRKPESDFDAVLDLAAYFQDDYIKKLPVIAALGSARCAARLS